jgi:hypothetical protein
MGGEHFWTLVPTAPEADESAALLEVFKQHKGTTRKLPQTCQLIRVLSGCAWISINGQDIIVESGHEIHLVAGEYAGVISNLCDDLLVYNLIAD